MLMNLATFQSLFISLLPVITSFSWKELSSPSTDELAQYLKESAPYFSMKGSGSKVFPADLCIGLPCESRACPETITVFQGMDLVWNRALTIVVNVQKEIISYDCVLRLIGYILSSQLSSCHHFAFIKGVSDEVAHVSIMSV